MRIHVSGALRGLALVLAAGVLPLAGGPLPAQQLKALKAQEGQRSARALAYASQQAPRLGLRTGEALTARRIFTTPEGRTVVRLDHTYAGCRVYGSSSIAHVEPDGRLKLVTTGLRPNAAPAGECRLTAEQAGAIALKSLRLRGQSLAPRVEKVVFPAALQGGLRPMWDSAAHKLVMDRTRSLFSAPLADAFVWAYQVDVAVWNKEDGVRDLHFVVDAATGAILRKLDNLQTEGAPTAAPGTGKGQYAGDVAVAAAQAGDGTFALQDPTRGSLPNPYFSGYEGLDITGIFTMGESHEGGDPTDYTRWGLNFFYAGRAANVWGDGLPFQDHPHENDVNGETAAVDAHYGLGLTWDMYRNIFGREGIDGIGTTPFAQVHIRDTSTGRKFDNAFWSGSLFGMFFGDGTYYPDSVLKDASGNAIEGNPDGLMSLTELDVTAHELSHGLMDGTAALSYSGESGGLNEANSDIMGALAEAYASRPAGQDGAIPDTGTDWLVGAKCRPAGPLRFMRKPSRDLMSADHWYGGLDWLDVHYSSGPMNRCFYFLAQGASADPAAETYSSFIPTGMTGIGNDKAARIWFKAISEYMTSQATYEEAAGDVVSAAADLYGESSPEVAAVKKAFTAINVQVAGEPLLARVVFPVVNTDGWLGRNPGSMMARTQIMPMGETVILSAQVLNRTDQRVTWKVGGHLGDVNNPVWADPSGVGVVNADGTWTAPMRQGWFVMTAASAAEPDQYSQGMVLAVNLDCDNDAEQDAVDMATTALSYYMPYSLKPTASPYNGPWVEDADANFFQTAIRNSWGAK